MEKAEETVVEVQEVFPSPNLLIFVAIQ